MDSEVIFIAVVFFLCLDFIVERGMEGLNLRAMSSTLPDELRGIYDEKEYKRFQNYQRDSKRLDRVNSVFSFFVMILFLISGGFGWYNSWIVAHTNSVLWQTLGFMSGLFLGAALLNLPFSWYTTFRIEEKYGFNRTSGKTYIADTLKGTLIAIVLGGGILALIVWVYLWAGQWFWLYAWGMISLFSVFMTMFYSHLIVPLFNCQTPLESGELREQIEIFAKRIGFRLENIYVIDGSKRSTKANAYFTGLGPKKRIVLYDTLIQELTKEEIVAVLAHETGHYKKHHTLQMMLASLLQTGLMLGLLAVAVDRPALSQALGGDQSYFQLGLIAFVLLYSPVSSILGLFMNIWSRKNEYEADAFAARNYNADALISGLKKISVKSLSNLTPHPWYEFIYYTHPSLLKRIKKIEEAK